MRFKVPNFPNVLIAFSVALLIVAVPAFAHHQFGLEFDF